MTPPINLYFPEYHSTRYGAFAQRLPILKAVFDSTVDLLLFRVVAFEFQAVKWYPAETNFGGEI